MEANPHKYSYLGADSHDVGIFIHILYDSIRSPNLSQHNSAFLINIGNKLIYHMEALIIGL